MKKATVYFTKEITPESLVKIYEALDRELHGKVAVKISTGEPDANPHDPEMADIGIFASLDPVAVDQACVDQSMLLPTLEKPRSSSAWNP